MNRLTSLLPFLLVGFSLNAQPTIQVCSTPNTSFDYGNLVQALSGIFTFETATCGSQHPNAASTVPFPTGTPTTRVKWMNVESSFAGPPINGNIAPVLSQPNLYVVCGKDAEGYNNADFNVQQESKTEFGGLYVGHYTPQGTFGNELDIICNDSLMLKELWVVEGATVNIYGPVYITEECHNAGTINIMEGGSLNFLVDQTLHQHALFENKGEVNGKISYEVLYFDHPLINDWNYLSGLMPSHIADTLDPYVADLDYEEFLEFFVDNYTVFTENVAGTYAANSQEYSLYGVLFSGYHLVGLPVSGVRMNPYDGDVTEKYRYKGFRNNSGQYYWAGRQEDLLSSIENSNVTLLAITDTDTLFFDPETYLSEGFTTDTTLLNDGVFQNIQAYLPEDPIAALDFFLAADSLTWVGYPDDYTPVTGWPGSFSTLLVWLDIRQYSSYGNPSWIDPQHGIFADSTGQNAFGIPTGSPRPLIQEEFTDYYPEGFRGKTVPTPSTNPNEDFLYAEYATLDANTPIHRPLGLWLHVPGSEYTPLIWEYEGYPWLNASTANEGQLYDPIPYGNQAIPVYQNETDNEYTFYLTNKPGLEYIYNLDGNLLIADQFDECITQNDTLYCFANTQSVEMGQVGDFVPVLLGDELTGTEVYLQGNQNINHWSFISNPINGYLNCDALVEDFFEDNPDIDHFEFAWYCKTGTPGATWNANPNTLDDAVQGYAKRFWRRKYHKYDDNVYSSELDYWMELLVDYATANPFVQNSLIQTFITDFQADSIINSPVALNYIQASPLTPFTYQEFGKYLLPGAGFWVRNAGSAPAELTVKPEHGIYDFDFPQYTPGYLIGGDQNTYERTSSPDSASLSLLLSIDYINDTTYWPATMLSHVWNPETENGLQYDEDGEAYDTFRPFIFGDSASFNAYTYVKEATPHNADPILGLIPEPDSAFCITPLVFQQNTDPSIGQQPFLRIGIRTNSRADTVTYENGDTKIFTAATSPIKYLAEGDTLWYRKRDYAYPVTVELFFTNLRGDVTGDGIVAASDFLDFAAAYGDCATDNPVNPMLQDFDINGDGCVGIADYLMLMFYYNHTLDANGSFEPVLTGSSTITESELIASTTNLRNDPAVTISGPEIRILGEQIELYDLSFKLVASSRNSIIAPGADTYIVVTNARLGYIDMSP